MDGTALVEVIRGLWVRPERVAAVISYGETTMGTTKLPPSVKLYFAGHEAAIVWEFEAIEDARGWAAKVAAAVNSAASTSAKPA